MRLAQVSEQSFRAETLNLEHTVTDMDRKVFNLYLEYSFGVSLL